MLAQERGNNYTFATDEEREPESMLSAIAIREKETYELRIPKSRYDRITVL
jgi:hypothetical protein